MRYYEITESVNIEDSSKEAERVRLAWNAKIKKAQQEQAAENLRLDGLGLTDDELVIQIEDRIFNRGHDIQTNKDRKADRRTATYKNRIKYMFPIAREYGVMKATAVEKAMRLYTTSHFGRMNNALRKGATPASTSLIDIYLKYASKYESDILYRGVSKEFFNTLAVGDTYTDPAFVSTTTDRAIAVYFAKRKLVGGVLVISGVNGVACHIASINPDESEYVLPRGCTFKVESIVDKTIQITLLSH